MGLRLFRAAIVGSVVIGVAPAIAGVTKFRKPVTTFAAVGLAGGAMLAGRLVANRRSRRVTT